MMYHIVKRGESLWLIAKQHNVTLQELIAANPQIKDPNFIMVGEKILLPPGAGHVDIPGRPQPPRPSYPNGGTGNNGTGNDGTGNDGMGNDGTGNDGIGNDGTGNDGIGNDGTGNDGTGNDGMENGGTDDELCKRLAALPRPLIYVVKRGDTLAHIAECFELPTPELLRVNPQIKNPDLIHPGDKIFIPRPRNVILPPGAQPGYPCPPGYHCHPNMPNRPGQPGRPDMPGRPGIPGNPGRPDMRPQPRMNTNNTTQTMSSVRTNADVCPFCGHKLS